MLLHDKLGVGVDVCNAHNACLHIDFFFFLIFHYFALFKVNVLPPHLPF